MKEMLEQSPMFQLSLGSKELFHSNFMYWMWKAEPDAFWGMMECLLDIQFNDKERETLTVEREWENFDLCIVRKEKINRKKKGKGKNEGVEEVDKVTDVVAVIENKVKSVPNQVQLNEYDSKLKKILKKGQDAIETRRILLSLMEPDFDSKWTRISYDDYLIILNRLKIVDKYHANIINDYRNMISVLVELKKEWIGDEKKIMSMNYMDIFDLKKSKDAVDLRINDMRQKMIFSKMFSVLSRELEDLKPAKGKSVEQILADKIKLAIGFGMTNATGLLDAKVNIGNNSMLGIQLQGDQYRHYIEFGSIPDNNDRIDYMSELRNYFEHGDNYGTQRGKICSYKNKKGEKSFLYVYQNKENSICWKTIGDVINQMVADIKYLMKKY